MSSANGPGQLTLAGGMHPPVGMSANNGMHPLGKSYMQESQRQE
jgi:hypothetical protein